MVNFVHKQTQEQMLTALRDVRGRLGKQYPLVINGQKITTGKWMPSTNPSNPDRRRWLGRGGGNRRGGSSCRGRAARV